MLFLEVSHCENLLLFPQYIGILGWAGTVSAVNAEWPADMYLVLFNCLSLKYK